LNISIPAELFFLSYDLTSYFGFFYDFFFTFRPLLGDDNSPVNSKNHTHSPQQQQQNAVGRTTTATATTTPAAATAVATTAKYIRNLASIDPSTFMLLAAAAATTPSAAAISNPTATYCCTAATSNTRPVQPPLIAQKEMDISALWLWYTKRNIGDLNNLF